LKHSRKHPKQNEMLFKRMNLALAIMVDPNQKIGHSVGYWFFIGEFRLCKTRICTLSGHTLLIILE
jgi:hypothetical protein